MRSVTRGLAHARAEGRAVVLGDDRRFALELGDVDRLALEVTVGQLEALAGLLERVPPRRWPYTGFVLRDGTCEAVPVAELAAEYHGADLPELARGVLAAAVRLKRGEFLMVLESEATGPRMIPLVGEVFARRLARALDEHHATNTKGAIYT